MEESQIARDIQRCKGNPEFSRAASRARFRGISQGVAVVGLIALGAAGVLSAFSALSTGVEFATIDLIWTADHCQDPEELRSVAKDLVRGFDLQAEGSARAIFAIRIVGRTKLQAAEAERWMRPSLISPDRSTRVAARIWYKRLALRQPGASRGSLGACATRYTSQGALPREKRSRTLI